MTEFRIGRMAFGQTERTCFTFKTYPFCKTTWIWSIRNLVNLPFKRSTTRLSIYYPDQCDLFGRFIGLWATFQILWQHLVCHKSPTLLGNFCKGVKIFNFCNEIIFGHILLTFGNFLLVTLIRIY